MSSSSCNQIDVLLTYPGDGLRLFQSMIPIGLVNIGTVLQQAGYRVALIDFNHYTNDYRRQLQFLRPKIIGIGGTTPSRKGSFLTARLSKQIFPEVPVVYGGVNATFTATDVLTAIPAIDFVVKGEGEFAFLYICNTLLRDNNTDFKNIPGVCYRTESSVIENKPLRINDLSLLPIPNRDLLGNHYRLDMEFIGGTGDFIMTSRGCPAACNFCAASRMFPGGVRLRPMDQVMAEVEYLQTRKKLTGLKLFDSTFTANRAHVKSFCCAIKKYNLHWECEVRADTVDADLLGLMKECGCYYINIGMETANQAHLRRISKGISSEQVLSVLAICKKLDIHSKVFFTFGHLGQTFKECMEDIRFIDRNRTAIDFFAVTVGMRIYPGTRLEKECREKNILPRTFSWISSSCSIKNLFLLDPSDVPMLFQRQLGPVRLLIVILILLSKKLICTERFIGRMILENVKTIIRVLSLSFNYTHHKIERLLGRELEEREWRGISRQNVIPVPIQQDNSSAKR